LRGTKYSILPALSLDGILHLEVVENTITGNIFHWFIEDLLPHMNEWPMPNSVLVVDNAAIHKVAGICELIEGHGAHLVYLPTYSPDFNPIELAFSSIKAWMRVNCVRVNAELQSDNSSIYNAFWEAVYSVMTDDAKGWYSHCGYRAPQEVPLRRRGQLGGGRIMDP
jgi:transposase